MKTIKQIPKCVRIDITNDKYIFRAIGVKNKIIQSNRNSIICKADKIKIKNNKISEYDIGLKYHVWVDGIIE